jgi:hypothetical protein
MIIYMMQGCERLLTLPLDGSPGKTGLPAPKRPQIRLALRADSSGVLDRNPFRAHPGDMDRRVMIMCDTRASGITADLADSYLVRVEPRANGGVTVLWTDLPDQAMVFDDAAAASEFCRDSPLEMFVVSFVPTSGPPAPAPLPTPAEPMSLAAELRAMGLM